MPCEDGESLRTPVWAANYGIVSNAPRGATGHAKVCKLDTAVFIGQDIGTLYVTMYNTLLVEVDESLEDLTDVDCDEGFREFSEAFADVVQGAVLAESVREG